MTRVEVPDSCSDFKVRPTSGFRPKLHSRAASLRPESLDMSRAVGCESLDIPKFVRESLDMGRESLDIPNSGRERLDTGRAVSGVVWKVAPSPLWLRGSDFWSRRLQLGLESRAVSALNAKVAPLPLRSRRMSSWSRRIYLDLGRQHSDC